MSAPFWHPPGEPAPRSKNSHPPKIEARNQVRICDESGARSRGDGEEQISSPARRVVFLLRVPGTLPGVLFLYLLQLFLHNIFTFITRCDIISKEKEVQGCILMMD